MKVVLGLDVGTTAVKAAAFAVDEAWRSVAVRRYPLAQPAPGRAEQEPAAVLSATADALAECAEAAGDAEVLAISVGAAMHGLLALDADQQPLTPLVTWADARAGGEAQALRRSGQGAELAARTGLPPHPMTPLAKLRWFAHHRPDLWRRARWWIGLKDLLLLWLTGSLVTELSSASGTGLLDVTTRDWSSQALVLCGLQHHQLPPVLAPTTVLPLAPAAAARIAVAAGTPVVVGAADGPLANLGVGAVTPGVAGLSLGTSGAVRMAVEGPCLDRPGSLFCYALTDAVWVVGGAVSNGAAVVQWAGSALGTDPAAPAGSDARRPRTDGDLLELAATAPPGSDGLVMLPYLLDERPPLWDPDLAGAYLGLRPDHGAAHLVRAALEGVCLQLRYVVDRLAAVAPVTAVRATGGATEAPLWRQLLAAALGRPLHVLDGVEGTALGAAALGLYALGSTDDLPGAVAALAGPDAEVPPALPAQPELVQAFTRLRTEIPGLLDALQRAAGG